MYLILNCQMSESKSITVNELFIYPNIQLTLEQCEDCGTDSPRSWKFMYNF